MTAKPKPARRPTLFSEELAAEICARIADGQSVREIARADDMPAMSSIFLWLTKHERFSEQYAKAFGARTMYLADELLDIADDGTNDWVERKNAEGEITYQVNGEAIQRSRLRVDTRKWILSKLVPKKYGNKVTAEITGADGGPVQTEVMSSLEIARRVAFLLASAAKDQESR